MTRPSPRSGDARHWCPSCERGFANASHCPHDGTRLVTLPDAEADDPVIGRDLDGRFRIEEKLGEGGMGAVYRAIQHSVDRPVAIKIVKAGLVHNADAVKRFLREARLSSRLSHPNAVVVLDFGQTSDGLFFLAMELLEGISLEEVLRAEGALPLERVLRIGRQICDALTMAHGLSIVHRDLKPANVMVLAQPAGQDHIKVLDFGVAKSLSAAVETQVTRMGEVLGSPAYLPPEIARGESAGTRADLYSLGVILYEMVGGQVPFHADSLPELLQMQAYSEPPPLRGAPPALARLVERLLAKDPEARPASAAEVRRELDAIGVAPVTPRAPIAPAAPGPALPSPTVTAQVAPPRSRRAVVAIAAVVAVVVLVGVASLLRGGGPAGEEQPAAASEPAPPPDAAAAPVDTAARVEPAALAVELDAGAGPPAPAAGPDAGVEPDVPSRTPRRNRTKKSDARDPAYPF